MVLYALWIGYIMVTKIKQVFQDENTYSEIEQNQIKSTMSKIQKLIKQHDQSLTDKEKD